MSGLRIIMVGIIMIGTTIIMVSFIPNGGIGQGGITFEDPEMAEAYSYVFESMVVNFLPMMMVFIVILAATLSLTNQNGRPAPNEKTRPDPVQQAKMRYLDHDDELKLENELERALIKETQD